MKCQQKHLSAKFEVLKDFLERFSYKPETFFKVIPNEDGFKIIVCLKSIDSITHKVGTLKEEGYSLSENFDQIEGWQEYLKRAIGSIIKYLEIHEMDEWLRFDDKRIKDPHWGEK